MLLRISLFVAILAGLAAGGLGYYEVTTQIPALTQQRDTENTAKKDALTKLATSDKNLKKTKEELATSEQNLSDTKGERDKAVARAEAQSKRADELSDKLAKALQERNDAQDMLAAYKATDLTPDQIVKLNKQLKEANTKIMVINGEKAVLPRSWLASSVKIPPSNSVPT
jgi:chromosome segregation ATPase